VTGLYILDCLIIEQSHGRGASAIQLARYAESDHVGTGRTPSELLRVITVMAERHYEAQNGRFRGWNVCTMIGQTRFTSEKPVTNRNMDLWTIPFPAVDSSGAFPIANRFSVSVLYYLQLIVENRHHFHFRKFWGVEPCWLPLLSNVLCTEYLINMSKKPHSLSTCA
jgi:hypothetical protein